MQQDPSIVLLPEESPGLVEVAGCLGDQSDLTSARSEPPCFFSLVQTVRWSMRGKGYNRANDMPFCRDGWVGAENGTKHHCSCTGKEGREAERGRVIEGECRVVKGG